MRNTVKSRVEKILEDAKAEARRNYNELMKTDDPKTRKLLATWCANAQRTADLLEAILDIKDEDSMNRAFRSIK